MPVRTISHSIHRRLSNLGFAVSLFALGVAAVAPAPLAAAYVFTVTMSPVIATVAGGGTLAVYSAVSGTQSVTITWYVDGIAKGNATVGTLTGSGARYTYTAPAAAGTHTITAVAVTAAGGTQTGTTAVTIPSGLSVTLSPAATTLASAGTLPFTATVAGATSPTLAWTVDGIANGNATVGTLTGSGTAVTYAAPAAAGTHTVAVKVNGTASASSVVTVQAPQTLSVTLAPGTASMTTSASLTYAATVSGTSSPTMAWTVDGIANGNSTVGTVTGTGTTVTYKAPAATGTHTIKATANGTTSASSAVTVTAPAPFTLTLTPGATTINASTSLPFYAAVSGTTSVTITWFVDGIAKGNTTVGTLTGSGAKYTYAAPAVPGTHTVTATATSSAGASSTGTTVVTVQTPPPVVLTPSPASVAMNPSALASISVAVTGSTNTAVTWTVDGVADGNATTGTLSGTGNTVTYTAPATAGSHTVVATSVANTLKTVAIPVSVVASSSISLTPAVATLYPAAGLSLTATVTGSTNTAVTWTVDGVANGNSTVGTVTGTSSTATYTAPAAQGVHTVKATSVADTTAFASAVLTVQNPVVMSISVPTASPANVNLSGALLVTAAVSGPANTSVTWSVDGVANGNATTGTITGSGNTVIYTAPAAAGSHTVKATSLAEPAKSASTVIAATATTAQVANTTLVVSVKDAPYSALGNGVTDDTAAIQKAVNAVAGTGGTVTIPAGTYMINPTLNNNAGIRLGSNMTLNLQTGAVLQALSTSTSNYAVLMVSGVQNVNIVGGTLVGNRFNNTISDTNENGMGVEISNSQNVVVENLTARDFWADGFYVTSFSKNVTLSNVVSDDSRRNGLSIVCVTNMVVRGSTFKNGTGSIESGVMANGSGVDIEPNPGDTVSTVLFSRCTFSSNFAQGLATGVGLTNTGIAFTNTIFADRNTFTANLGDGVDVANCSGTSVTNNAFTSNGRYGILFHAAGNNSICTGNTVTLTTGTPGNGITEDTCSGNVITGNTCTSNGGQGLYSVACTGSTLTANTCSGNTVAP